MSIDEEITLGKIKADLEYIKRDIAEIKQNVKIDYVTRDEFAPIKSIVYGMVTLVLTGVIGALIALVVNK